MISNGLASFSKTGAKEQVSTWVNLVQEGYEDYKQSANASDVMQMFTQALSGDSAHTYNKADCPASIVIEEDKYTGVKGPDFSITPPPPPTFEEVKEEEE